MNCVIEIVVCNSHDMFLLYFHGFESLLPTQSSIPLVRFYFSGCPKQPVSSEEWLFPLKHKVTNSSL